MQQTWQRITISLTAFFSASFQFGEGGRMRLSSQGPLKLQQMGGTHSSYPPEAGKKQKQRFCIAHS